MEIPFKGKKGDCPYPPKQMKHNEKYIGLKSKYLEQPQNGYLDNQN